ncbi:MAG TPA: tetratricopeptide repeat protein, partial [Jiangellaceae bacterium]
LLMVALYRSGRQARALTAYRALRQRLAKELGAEPGRELRELHDAIRAEDPELLARSNLPDAGSAGHAPPARPAQVPPVPGAFVGRERELAELDEQIERATDAFVVLITGMAGVGKTGLAVRLAHLVGDRFGDGQLYVDLRGHAEAPSLQPMEALGQLLRGLGADPARAAESVESATAEFRSLIAGRKMLVLLDNAASADQVRPLLPASPGCLTLVTSRNRLPGLTAREGAHRIALDVLPAADARELMTQLLGSERAKAEADHVTALVEACGGLPLGLRIAAAQLADEPHRPVGDYLAELQERGLEALALDDDEHSAVAAAFDLSYQRLDPDARRLFRLVGLVPGLDFTLDAVAALVGAPAPNTREMLRRVTRAHLLDEHAAGRYRFHDLLRDYARHRAATEETAEHRTAALNRLFTWYYRSKESAEALFRSYRREPPRPALADGVAGLEFHDGHDAASWLTDEFGNLTSSARVAAHDPALAPWSWHLVLGAGLQMARRGYLAETRSALGRAVEAARSAADRHAIAHTLTEFGAVETIAGSPVPDSLVAEVLAHGESVGDRGLIGYCLFMAAVVQQRKEGHAEATDLLERSRAEFRLIGDPGGQALTLNYLGGLALMQGDLRRAVDWWEEILKLEESPTTMSALINLSLTLPMLGRIEGVEALLDRAEVLIDRQGDGAKRSVLLCSRGQLLLDAGRIREGLDHLVKAQQLAAELSIPRLEVDAGADLGFGYLALGDHESALRVFEHALDVARSSRLRAEGSKAAAGLAESLLVRGDLSAAEARVLEAIELAGEEYRLHRGNALVTLARIDLASGRVDDAIGHGEEALTIHRETGHVLGTARAHRVIGEALIASGDPGAAPRGVEHLREALRRFETFGSLEGEDVRAALARA